MQEVRADGNCLFRAIADQLDGDQNNHDTYRQAIVEYIIKCKDDFAPFVEDDVDFETYVEQMKEDAEWGGQIELTACSRLYSVNITIHHLDAPMYVIKNNVEKDCDTLILSYHDGEHYNSVKRARDIDSGEPVCKYKILNQENDNNEQNEKHNNVEEIDDDGGGGEWKISAAEKRKQKRLERKARRQKKEMEKMNRRRNQYNNDNNNNNNSSNTRTRKHYNDKYYSSKHNDDCDEDDVSKLSGIVGAIVL